MQIVSFHSLVIFLVAFQEAEASLYFCLEVKPLGITRNPFGEWTSAFL